MRQHVRGGALDLGLAAVGLDPADPEAAILLPGPALEQAGLEPDEVWARPRARLEELGAVAAERARLPLKQGRAMAGVDMRIVDDAGQALPWDGTTYGNLQVRGPWVTRRYMNAEADATEPGGWFATGDVATIDEHGFMEITDRTKDIVKSGGEWISSIALENIAVSHPDVAEAAIVGAHHPKWDERPLLIVVAKEGREVDPADLLGLYAGQVAKWWTPDEVVVVDALPHTATGKINKLALRRQFRDYKLASAAE